MKKNINIIIISSALFLALIITSFFAFKFETTSAQAQFASLDLGKINTNEAQKIIEKRIEDINNQGILYRFKDTKALIPSNIIAFDSELAYEIYFIDTEKNLALFLDYYEPNLINKLNSFFSKKERKLNAQYRLHQERWWQTLVDLFNKIEKPAQNAYFYFNNNELQIAPEEFGLTIEKEKNLINFKNHLENLSLDELELSTKEIIPEIKEEDLIKHKEEIIRFLENKEFLLNYKKENWPLENNEIVTWFTISEDNLNLDEQKIINYLEKSIAPDINREALLPNFEVENNRILNWQAGKSGQELLLKESAQEIKKIILQEEEEKIEIVVEETMGDDVEGLAAEIIEIIGTGHSNFAGSPSNRIHNIKVGTNVYSGLIIAPGEEFSVIENLGPVNQESGYLPELVIKEGKTIPEYGGGLCQVSTTLFRAALNAGLPITARQNHSYRVSYYEPAGTDAAIYNPWPDLKFINDTDHHIMIQSRLIGNDLYFDFWGTSDKREVSISDPVIYNIVSPPPTKLIVSEELAPGERKCTERAHNGANAYFDYVVKHQDGETIEKRFNSYYVPWQEVCLIGPDEEEVLENDEDVEEEDNNEDL